MDASGQRLIPRGDPQTTIKRPLGTRLPIAEKAAFERKAAEHGKSSAALLLEVIRRFLSHEG